MTARKDPRIDDYIAKSAPFARPVLEHIRKVVHAGCPDVDETLKWGHPSFTYKGILCGMASFKEHCAFGFWKHALLEERGLAPADEKAMGQFGRLQSVADLPAEKTLVRLVRAAVALHDEGATLPRKPKPPKDRKLDVPAYLTAALKKNAKARATFDAFSYSNKKDYVEWLTEAKTDATRERRLATTLEWLADGKTRNWKYMR